MVFPDDVSDKVLEKDIIPPKEKEFEKTWVEFQAGRDKQIFREIRTGGANQTLFVVPSNNTFYLMNCFLFSNTNGGGTSLGLSSMQINNVRIISIDGDDSVSNRAGVTYNFTMPLKIEENTIIAVTSGLPFEVINAGIVGFLVDKRITP